MIEGPVGKRRIGEMLVSEGLVRRAQVQEALAIQQDEGGRVVEILLRLGHLRSEDLKNFLSSRPGLDLRQVFKCRLRFTLRGYFHRIAVVGS